MVQLYASAPYTLGGIEKAHKVLVGFAKTKLLQPGESETVTVSFDPYSAASYDYRDANNNGFSGYELEAGEYTLYVSRNAHESEKAIALNLAADVQIGTDPTTDSEVVNRYTDSEDFLDSDWQLDTMLSARTGRALGPRRRPRSSTRARIACMRKFAAKSTIIRLILIRKNTRGSAKNPH